MGGAGDLYQRFLRLKALLQAEGLFDAARKRPIPAAPQAIGVVSSPQAAALRDVLTTLRRRAPQVPVIIYPASVQGAAAPGELVRALQAANRRAECDVILLVRGGGSLQDLDAFNDERLARTIAASRLPVVSGVGHETDFTLADFVADERAPTPTAAAVLVSPDRLHSLQQLARAAQRLRRSMRATIERGEQRLDMAARLLRSPAEQWRERMQRVARAVTRIERAMQHDVQRAQGRLQLAERSLRPPSRDLAEQRLAALRDALARAQRTLQEDAGGRIDRQAAALASYNPRAVLERGYAIVRDARGEVVRAAGQVAAGDALAVELAEGELRVSVVPGMGSAVG
jgi:exodeoxyribonuclease VII large subunit